MRSVLKLLVILAGTALSFTLFTGDFDRAAFLFLWVGVILSIYDRGFIKINYLISANFLLTSVFFYIIDTPEGAYIYYAENFAKWSFYLFISGILFMIFASRTEKEKTQYD